MQIKRWQFHNYKIYADEASEISDLSNHTITSDNWQFYCENKEAGHINDQINLGQINIIAIAIKNLAIYKIKCLRLNLLL